MKYIENQLKAKIVKLQDKNNNFAFAADENILLLDSYCNFKNANQLSELVGLLQQQNIGIISPLIVDSNEKIIGNAMILACQGIASGFANGITLNNKFNEAEALNINERIIYPHFMSSLQIRWDYRHGTCLCAHKGAHVHCPLVCLTHGLAVEQPCHKTAGEAVAGAHGISHLNARCWAKRLLLGCEHIAAVHSACEHHHLHAVQLHEPATFFAHINARQLQQSAHYHQLFVVDFEHTAAAHRLFNHLSAIEVLPQIDVEHP